MSVGPLSLASPQRMTTPGSLTSLMDALAAIQALVPGELQGFPEALTVYRWKPQQADLPALYNWLLPSTSELRDLSRIRDSVVIATRIVTGMSDTLEDRMPFVEAAADAYRAIVDSNFWDGMRTPQSGIGSAATWAIRSSMNSVADEVGGVPVMGIEVVQSAWLDRHIR